MRLAQIAGFRLVTQESERSVRFFAALGFEADEQRPIASDELAVLGVAGRGLRRPLRAGRAHVDLDWFDVPGARYPNDTVAASPVFQHMALVTDDVAGWWSKAQAAGAAPISRHGPVTVPPEVGGVTAIKFRDPEGHPLELIRFPDNAAKGWPGSGVLGIDHSAMVGSDLAASLAFYRELGASPADPTLNQGPTQEALDGLDGVRVDVVPLLPSQATPHLELLHYRHPRAARGVAWAPNDVAATRIVWRGPAPGLLHDPDGHMHQIEG